MVTLETRPRDFIILSGLVRSPRTAKSLWRILAVVALLCFWAAIAVSAESSRPSEYELKATFLYNFIKFTGWPHEALAKNSDPFVIGILGKDPFGTGLDRVIEGETVNDKTVVVKRLARTDQAANTQV